MRAGRPKKFFENLLRAYSYTLFDDIGRTIEAGELLTRQSVPILMHESQVKYDSIAQRFVHSGVRREITRSYYDEAVYTDIAPYFAQENLRPRVSSVTYQDKAGTAFDRATHYSYDVHGNVKTLIQQVRDGQRELKKRIDYDYDLVSGKINRIYYQKGESDQFIHRYDYDGDNRITGVQTSRDGIVWTQDAAYAYYAHGPLARAIIGDSLEIQDHAYTLQGWMKALNGQYFSYALGYFSGDYQSIGTHNNLATPVAASKDLYNGNIATMASLNPKLSATTWTQQFEYDQLNRIKASASIGLAHADAFRTGYRYDANGNIERLHRYNEAGDAFDSLVYHYENRAGGYLRNTNKLRWVDDSPGLSGHHTEDLEDQDMDNYRYDDLGNLVYDAQEEIARIEWNVYGKISKVIRTEESTRPDLEFLYDATGNRVAKIVKPKDANATITYYIRDAQGNVLSVYKKSESGQTAELEEQYIYGSSRVGMLAAGGANNTRTLGLRSYELTDHLGNVRTVISDKPTALGLTEMLAAYDYYPFGMIARSENSGLSRHTYNGKEYDRELRWQEYGERMYNPNLGRFPTVDPIAREYPWLTPYQFASNDPIRNIDIDGLEGGSAIENYVIGELERTWNYSLNSVKDWWNSWSLLPSSAPNSTAPPINTNKSQPVLKQSTEVEVEAKVKNNSATSLKSNVDLSSSVPFVSQFSLSNPNVACCRASQKILKDFGIEAAGAKSNRIITGRNNADNTAIDATKDAKAGVTYINEQLEAGNPVMVGVNHNLAKAQSDGEAADHFVVITGRSYDTEKKQYYFNFYEVGTKHEDKGKSSSNKLYVNSDNTITGTNYAGQRQFTVTDVRKNE